MSSEGVNSIVAAAHASVLTVTWQVGCVSNTFLSRGTPTAFIFMVCLCMSQELSHRCFFLVSSFPRAVLNGLSRV